MSTRHRPVPLQQARAWRSDRHTGLFLLAGLAGIAVAIGSAITHDWSTATLTGILGVWVLSHPWIRAGWYEAGYTHGWLDRDHPDDD